MTSKKRERILGALVGICLALLGADRFILTPWVSSWKAHCREADSLKADRARYLALLEHQSLFQTKIAEIHSHQLPADPSKAENTIVNSLSNWATSSGMQLASVRPSQKANRDEQHPSLTFRLSARGTLEALVKFVEEIETSKLPLLTRQFGISSRNERGRDLELDLEVEAALPSLKTKETLQ
jgi:hypothetical protein